MHFTMNVCTASPKLFLACAGGDHIPEAVLSVRKSGGGSHPETYVKWKFTDVVISKYDNLGSMGGLIPHDDFSITFAKVEFEYRPQKANGSLGGAIPAGWDLKQGTKV
jgi:type VI secretion system secreted protein Hcp